MPIKLLSFGRRKSSGNILDDVESTPQSSFRVFQRPGDPLPKRMSEGDLVLSHLDGSNPFAGTERPMDKPQYDRPRFADSLKKRLTGTRDSGGAYESSTSTRLSSSSTLPSSTEISPPDETFSPHSRINDVPPPPPLRPANRAFSLGGRLKALPPSPQHNALDASAKHRATSSSDSTTLPPRLPDTNIDLSGADDFQKMFDNVGKREPSPRPTYQSCTSPPTHRLPEFETDNKPRPAPINTDRSIPVQSSPFSWDRHYSEEEELLGASDAFQDINLTEKESSLPPTTGSQGPSRSYQMSTPTTSHRSLERARGKLDQLRRSGVYPERRDSEPIDDEDAKLVRQSLLWSKENSPPRWTEGDSTATETPPIDKGKMASPERLAPDADNMFSNRPSPVPTESSSITGNARLAVQFAENLPKPTSPANKVMTPSQFERYRQQQALRRSNSNASQSDESANDEYDEEDEVEKQREAERLRRKQEARLSVYRQQMTKMTGQQISGPSLRPVVPNSSSTPNLLKRLSDSNSGDKSASGKSSEDDDEEVPLGILAAHGFPNRNRPPTRLNNVTNLRASAQPQISSGSSVAGAEPDMNNRGNLPVFAKNLPKDPYFGAGLVNPSNRESLALGGGSVYGGASPPGGLVGVIASEERARAMRRGSPNAHAVYEQMGVPRPYTMMSQQQQQQQQMSATEQAQVQLSQQMAHMMQMQMQWMQQMMQMQGIQGAPPMMKGGMQMPPMMGGPPMPEMPTNRPMSGQMLGAPSMAGGNPNMRSMSMHAATAPPPHGDQRTLSMLDPNIMRRNGSPMPPLSGNGFRPNTPGYAPSIAPSDRTNMGMASRYRPVSTMQDEGHPGASMSKPWNDENHPISSQPRSPLPKSTSMATVTVRPDSRLGAGSKEPPAASDEEDDDQGWAEMMKKRDKKKSSWKMKRGTSSFGDLLSVVH